MIFALSAIILATRDAFPVLFSGRQIILALDVVQAAAYSTQ
jgi:hypothetical protein